MNVWIINLSLPRFALIYAYNLASNLFQVICLYLHPAQAEVLKTAEVRLKVAKAQMQKTAPDKQQEKVQVARQ